MKEYSDICIYSGLQENINLDLNKFNIITEIDKKLLDNFKLRYKDIHNKEILFINGLPISNKEKLIYWHKYNDKRFDGLIPEQNLFKQFPNIKLISKNSVKGILLKTYLDFGLILSNKVKISLIIRQGNIKEIIESIKLWIEFVDRIEIIGFAQNYLFRNKIEKNLLENKGFTKISSEKFLEIIYLKTKKQSEKKRDLESNEKSLKKVLAEMNNNKDSSRLNLIRKEAKEALDNKKENIFCALDFYLNKFESKNENSAIEINSINELRLLDIGAEGVLILVNNSVIKVYRDKYFRFKNEFKSNHEPYFLSKYNSEFFPKPKSFGNTYMELNHLGAPIGLRPNLLNNPQNSVKISEDTIINALRWLKDLKIYLKKNKIIHKDIHLGNILYDNVLNKFTLVDFTCARSKEINGLDYKKDLNTNRKNFLDDSQSIDLISNILIQKLVIEFLKINCIDDNQTMGEVFNYLNKTKDLNLDNKKFEYEKLAKLISLDSKSFSKLIKCHNISYKFSMLPIYLLKNSSKVVSINSDIFCTRIFEGLKIKNNLINLSPLNMDLSKYTFEKEDDYEDIIVISDINVWLNYDFIDDKFNKFILKIKNKCKAIYLNIDLIDDIKEFQELVIDYFTKMGFNFEPIIKTKTGVSDAFNLIKFYVENS